MARPSLLLATMLSLVLGAGAACGQALYSQPQSLAKLPDGRRINFICAGDGGPTVVLEGGLGLPSMVWSKLQPMIAAHNKVCVYERPGYGFSDPGPLPRTAARNAADLHAGLKALGLRPPFVLVAHSRAGFDARQFAHIYPRETAGLVLVDVNVASDADWGVASAPDPCVVAAADGRLRPGDPLFARCGSPASGSDAANPDKARAALSELENIAADGAATARITSYGRIPTIVLTAGAYAAKAGPGVSAEQAKAAQDALIKAHAALAAQSRQGEHRVIAGSGHVIQYEKPEAVAQAVADVIAMGRR